MEEASAGADILAPKHVSRILEHCINPALPFCPVWVCGTSSCSVLKYRLENQKQEVLGVAMSENPTDVLESEDICA